MHAQRAWSKHASICRHERKAWSLPHALHAFPPSTPPGMSHRAASACWQAQHRVHDCPCAQSSFAEPWPHKIRALRALASPVLARQALASQIRALRALVSPVLARQALASQIPAFQAPVSQSFALQALASRNPALAALVSQILARCPTPQEDEAYGLASMLARARTADALAAGSRDALAGVGRAGASLRQTLSEFESRTGASRECARVHRLACAPVLERFERIVWGGLFFGCWCGVLSSCVEYCRGVRSVEGGSVPAIRGAFLRY
eukprot:361939-Chlamydomonas_euryale.AAC.6